MADASQIEPLLRSSSELRQQIVRNLGSSTVALFAVFRSDGTDLLQLAGTGTLVVIDNCYYILTAAHVWEEVLKSAAKMGITLTDNINHQFFMDVETVIPTTLKPDVCRWNEWGPDLALLRIPSRLIGAIKAFQVFEDLKAPRKHLGVDALECWVAMGTPKELGTFTQNHAEIQITGDFVGPQHQHHGGQDYFDFEVDTRRPEIPKDFGGFSGGGLWRVLVYYSPQTNKIDWAPRLRGVIFWQFPLANGTRFIRAHGPKSIVSELLQSKEAYDILKYDPSTG